MRLLVFSLLLILATIFNTTPLSAQLKKEIIGYYPNWKYYERDNLIQPANFKFDKVTILNYSFFAPQDDGSIKSTDEYADGLLLKGAPDWDKGGFIPNTSLIDLAHKSNVRVFVSIGGWTLSDKFSDIANDAGKRAKFALNCVNLIKEYNFDGIDIDWEYPGFADHNGRPFDKVNYTKLMQSIRTELNNHTKTTGKKYALTACFSASPLHIVNVEVDKLIPILDMFNIMTYDFSGSWDALSGHNSPLYSFSPASATSNFDAAFKMFHVANKVPADKINLGIAFYGRAFANCTGLGETHSGADLVNFPNDEAAPTYHEILTKINQYNRTWDDKANAPYLTGKTLKSFVTYDDEQSVSLKADYVIKNNAKGVIIWEISGDYVDKNTTPLQDQLNLVFRGLPNKYLGNVITSAEPASMANISSPNLSVFPNPSGGRQLEINIRDVHSAEVQVMVYDLIGNLHGSTKVKPSGESDSFKFNDLFQFKLNPGIYFLKMIDNEKDVIQRFVVN
ncbi:MAG TPA: glycosyl hydrolase family 18 protein [Cytophagaceae bacterium]|jgi:chitinase